MSESLYALTSQYEALLEYADSTDPEDEQVFLDTLESITAEIGIKADNYAVVIHNIQGKREILKKEIDILQKKVEALDRNEASMKERMAETIRKVDPEKKTIRGEIYKFSLQKNGGKVGIEYKDGAEIPEKFIRVVYEPDTDKIREALEGGEQLDFAKLKERGEHLVIR
jgi:hypothetical protein